MDKMQTRLLLAEDDRNLGNILKNYLEAKGYATTLCVNGQDAIEAFSRKDFDFCILDIMMPVKDGFTTATEIRAANKKIPILFLTAKTLQEDKLKGFEIGADDYITKPFSMEELLLRLQAILRRTDEPAKTAASDNVYTIGIYTFDYNRQTLISRIKEQKLTSKEAGLLRLLCTHANEVLDRSTALNETTTATSMPAVWMCTS
jgi:DNA-binding response OmpR family regulator